MQFSRSVFIFRLVHVLEPIHFRYQRCDICVDLHMLYNYMLRMAVLDRVRGWFYYVFIRGKDKRSEGDGYPDSFKPKTLLLTDGDHLLTREGPEKVGTFIPKPQH